MWGKSGGGTVVDVVVEHWGLGVGRWKKVVVTTQKKAATEQKTARQKKRGAQGEKRIAQKLLARKKAKAFMRGNVGDDVLFWQGNKQSGRGGGGGGATPLFCTNAAAWTPRFPTKPAQKAVAVYGVHVSIKRGVCV